MESAPNPNSNNPLERKMPWTNEDIETANRFFKALKTFSGTYNEKKNSAARAIQYAGGYASFPDGVKSYISHLANQIKNRRKEEAKELALDNEPIAHPKKPEEIWFDDLMANESMQHGLHPEDEADIIKKLSKSD